MAKWPWGMPTLGDLVKHLKAEVNPTGKKFYVQGVAGADCEVASHYRDQHLLETAMLPPDYEEEPEDWPLR